MRTVRDMWLSFQANVIPKDAPAIQHEECRRAFYSGAKAQFTLQMEATEPPDEEECIRNIEALNRELDDFILHLTIPSKGNS